MKTLSFTLEHGKLLRLEGAQAWEVRCQGGALMLSGPWPLGDVELHPGQSCTLPTAGLVLAEAWGASRLSLAPPADQPLRRSFAAAHVFQCS
ncbi:DUF2917 domain-containing protein [Azovibrio restrictus]|uniref:DUF2917 domain-containing protein n=1 Tax=Azovibrio restrictus TaxID=146938 RepID=UPI0026EBF496|nr:DUF2917 domain-containing protein [Azovibrio restrictus]MDD3481661.1 DUF2917 domain-containing protein [Azovibrio restrictus]